MTRIRMWRLALSVSGPHNWAELTVCLLMASWARALPSMLPKVYTVGHSNRSIEEFLEIVHHYTIEVVFDVRRFPSSRKYPHFNKDSLRRSLAKMGVEYFWMKNMGGYRGYVEGAEKYKCFRAQGYRNYAAWMESDEWRKDFMRVVDVAKRKTSAIMCSERIPWRCHRKLISDALLAAGFQVIHIIEIGRTYIHRLTRCARIVEGKLIYV